MSKILALDLGEAWVGSALSDSSLIVARPHKTVPSGQLEIFLRHMLEIEDINTVIIGYPKTMSGNISQQTQRVIDIKENLAQLFPDITFILWDERLSSKRAENISKPRSKDEKLHAHSIAAAFILDSYLGYLAHQKAVIEDSKDEQ